MDLNMSAFKQCFNRFGVFPLGQTEILFCQTLLKDFEILTESLWISPKRVISSATFQTVEMAEVESRLFLFVHQEGQFLVPGSMNSFQLRNSLEMKQLTVQISGTEIVKDDTHACNLASNVYDTCLQNLRKENSGNCSLPFLYTNISMTQTCHTYKEGQTEMKKMSNLINNCTHPCVQYETKIVENPVLYTVSKNSSYELVHNKLIGAYQTRKPAKNNKTSLIYYPGYYINLPKFIPYYKSSHKYDAISYIAEFGGWASLFLGVSLSGCLLVCLRHFQSLGQFNNSASLSFTKGIKFLIYLLCIAYISYLTLTLVSKLMENSLSASISLEESKVDFALTVCTTQLIREEVSTKDNDYVKEFSSLLTEAFYAKWKKLSSTVSNITISTTDGGEKRIDPRIIENVSQVNLPLTNGSMDFCHQLDISSFNGIENIQLMVTSEMKVFLHYPGQFLHSWKNWRNVFSVVTKDSYNELDYNGDNGYNLYGLDISFELEKTSFSIGESNLDYDECFLHNLLENDKLKDGYKQLIRSLEVDTFAGKARI